MKKQDRFSWEKVTLSELQCSILLVLIRDNYPFNQKAFAKRTGGGISGVSKALNELERKGLVVSFKQDIRAYMLNPHRTEEIKKFITGYDLGKNKPFIISGHATVFEAEINDLPTKLSNVLEKDTSFIAYSPKNWKYAFSKATIDGSYKLHKTNKGCKLVAYFRTFGFTPAIIEQINTEKFFDLKKDLEDKYPGLKIGVADCIASCPWEEYAIQKDYVAVAGIALGIKHKKIEQSYGYPEWEEKGHDAREKIEKIIKLRDQELNEDQNS